MYVGVYIHMHILSACLSICLSVYLLRARMPEIEYLCPHLPFYMLKPNLIPEVTVLEGVAFQRCLGWQGEA